MTNSFESLFSHLVKTTLVYLRYFGNLRLIPVKTTAKKLLCSKSKNTQPIRKFRRDSVFLKIPTEKSKTRQISKNKIGKKKSLAVKTSEKHNLQK